MASIATHRLRIQTNPFLPRRNSHSPNHFHTNPLLSRTHSLLSFSHKPPTHSNSVHSPVNSLHPHNPSQNLPKTHFALEILVLFAFSLTLLSFRLFSNVLLPDFPRRWQNLIAFSEEAEAEISTYPSHLWRAMVAYEDRRFFQHCGIDPVGIARAVLSFSALGGGSTITQQLVKNTFLRNERKLSRKIVEMVLALALERTISKWRILSSYMSKIYWGHGVYGIQSASTFYFGKHPSLLLLGESALLAGMIPSPELRSPFRHCSRGKTFQTRVLKRMVELGILDIETALLVAKQSLHLCFDGQEYADGLLRPMGFFREGLGGSNKLKQEGIGSIVKTIWDWEKESKAWEAWEDMERWAMRFRHQTPAEFSG